MKRRKEQPEIDLARSRAFAGRLPSPSDYDPVRPVRRPAASRASSSPTSLMEVSGKLIASPSLQNDLPALQTEQTEAASTRRRSKDQWTLKRGHALSYAGLFLFTVLLYARPAEFYPSRLTASLALIVALVTLSFFVPTQLSLEGTLTARPTEVNLVLLFCLTALLSIPLAINRPIAWQEFSGTFIRCVVIFIVIVNVVRTKTRLKGLLFLAIASSLWLSLQAINDYRLGLLTIEGYRASGLGSGIFGNTNDMALHVVTIFPITMALLLGSRGLLGKLLYGVCAALMVAGIVLSYSRGAFVSLVVVVVFLAVKIGPRHRLSIVMVALSLGSAVLLFAPDKYGGRLLSIFIPSLDPGGSSDARRGELFRSAYLALRHPLLGIGMGNYQPEMSYRGLVTHNSYTQVGAELGLAALACYWLFVVRPLRSLGQIARETFAVRSNSSQYYLALGLQASLVSYMVASFFLSVAFNWYVYYLVAFAVCLRRIYEAETGKAVVVEKRKQLKTVRKQRFVKEERALVA